MPKQSGSIKKTTLSAVEQYELNQWLEENRINANNLRRSFTDVLPLARLLSRYYPEMIDLNYYPPRNSVQNKLCNWESFNKRVLARLGLQQTREQMVRVARSVPGSVDLLLYSVMRVQLAAERKAREDRRSTDEDEDDEENANDSTQAAQNDDADDDKLIKLGTVREVDSTPKVKHIVSVAEARGVRGLVTKSLRPEPLRRGTTGTGTHVAAGRNKRQPRAAEQNTATAMGATATLRQRGEKQQQQKQQQQQLTELPKQRMVLYSIYMQAVKQLQRRNAKIERFDQWSAHLENMLQLKCERIDELQRQVAVAATACRHKPPLRIGEHRRSRLRRRNLHLAKNAKPTIVAMLEAAKMLK